MTCIRSQDGVKRVETRDSSRNETGRGRVNPLPFKCFRGLTCWRARCTRLAERTACRGKEMGWPLRMFQEEGYYFDTLAE